MDPEKGQEVNEGPPNGDILLLNGVPYTIRSAFYNDNITRGRWTFSISLTGKRGGECQLDWHQGNPPVPGSVYQGTPCGWFLKRPRKRKYGSRAYAYYRPVRIESVEAV